MTCTFCGREYAKKPGWGWEHFLSRTMCSRECEALHRPKVLTDYTVTDTGCWEWCGRIDSNGYGKAYDPSRPIGNRMDWAHRVSYRAHRGDIPEGHELDHTCENTRCINPDHLDPVTRQEHLARTIRRAGDRTGRFDMQKAAAALRHNGLTYAEIAEALGMARKESAYDAVKSAIANGLVDPASIPPVPRLTDEQRDDIRMLCNMGIPQTEVAAFYGIDSSHVSRVVNGRKSRSTKEKD
ncbi:HNH endonuclease [Microbacterium sp. KNMS]